MSTRKVVMLFADGACIPNPGPGGWAFRLQLDTTAAEMSGPEPRSTNLRMEIVAVIKGIQRLKEPCDVTLYTDSDYVYDGLTRWLASWKKQGWKTSSRDPVKNLDLWMELDKLLVSHRVKVEHPTTDQEIQLNARVDQFANKAATTQVGSDISYFRQ